MHPPACCSKAVATRVALTLMLAAICCGTTESLSTIVPPSVSTSTGTKTGRTVVPRRILNPTEDEIKQLQQEIELEARTFHKNEIFSKLFIDAEEFAGAELCTAPTDMKRLHGPQCGSDLPQDFPPGHLLRLGPNGAGPTEGFLDGDGMIHCVGLQPGKPSTYSATYVNTEGRQREALMGKTYAGTLGAAPQGLPLLQSLAKNAINLKTLQCQKDTCNTGIGEMGGRLLAMMEQCKPTEFSINEDGSITTVQAGVDLNGAIPNNSVMTGGALSAHGRTCPETGDRIHVTYTSASAPFGRVDVFENDWQLKRSIPLDDMPCSVMLHDCAITDKYALILDFPLTLRPSRMFLQNRFPVEYEPENGARIGLVSWHGDEPTRWFDVKPGVVLHAVNAYETDDGKVVLHAQRSEPDADRSYITDYSTAFLYEWTMDLQDGSVEERWLNAEQMIEFPAINDDFNGQPCDHTYCVDVMSIGGPIATLKNPGEGILIQGVVKMALQETEFASKGDVIGRFIAPKDWYVVSEPSVVNGANGREYVTVIITKVKDEDDRPTRSQLLVLDSDRMEEGPVTAIELPHTVPYGLHSHFSPKNTAVGM